MPDLKTILVPWHVKPFLCGIGVAVACAVLAGLWVTVPASITLREALVYTMASVGCFTWIGIFAYQMDR